MDKMDLVKLIENLNINEISYLEITYSSYGARDEKESTLKFEKK